MVKDGNLEWRNIRIHLHEEDYAERHAELEALISGNTTMQGERLGEAKRHWIGLSLEDFLPVHIVSSRETTRECQTSKEALGF